MTFSDEMTFEDWPSLLWSCEPWAEVRERTGQLRLLRDELNICVLELPGRWRARHRRGLHRLGFRRFSSPGLDVWRWTLSLGELSAAARSHPLVNAAGPRTRVHERLAWTSTRERLVQDQLRRALSEVFGYEPTQLCLDVPADDYCWDDPDDDAWDDPDDAAGVAKVS